jgi:glycosyltransferase involved in cell wall biosynthesis
MKILFACPYPTGRIASQRFRFEQYFPLLTKNNIDYETAPFSSSHFDPANDRSMSNPLSSVFSRVNWLLKGIWSRVKLFSRLREFDFVFIHREMAPVGPPVFEWLIARVWGKKIIYDFDDAIWLTDRAKESTIERILRCRGKVALICRWSYRVSCGSRYLKDYARKFNPEALINPTTIETTQQHNPKVKEGRKNGPVTIGWTGSHSTLKYLRILVPVLQSLEQKYPDINFLVIADEDPKLPLKHVAFLQWNLETEMTDLASIDIGIMPLPDDAWTRGKGGFKALQFMAMEIPAVVSPVGINMEIVTHSEHGFLCSTDQEWFTHLEELILNYSLRREMGRRGRQKVIAHYSVASNAENFLSLFQ